MYPVGKLQAWHDTLAGRCQDSMSALQRSFHSHSEGSFRLRDLALEQKLRDLATLIEPVATINAASHQLDHIQGQINDLSASDYTTQATDIAKQLTAIECQLDKLPTP